MYFRKCISTISVSVWHTPLVCVNVLPSSLTSTLVLIINPYLRVNISHSSFFHHFEIWVSYRWWVMRVLLHYFLHLLQISFLQNITRIWYLFHCLHFSNLYRILEHRLLVLWKNILERVEKQYPNSCFKCHIWGKTEDKVFPTTYSSSLDAGTSVRGEAMLLCIPSVKGTTPAELLSPLLQLVIFWSLIQCKTTPLKRCTFCLFFKYPSFKYE